MTTSNCKSSIFIAFLCLALLLSSTGGALRIMKEVFCGQLSGTFEGVCLQEDHCSLQCKEKEGADDGVCSNFKCWCKYKCGNVCQKPSGIWKGLCFNSSHCDKQCKEKENAVFGTCSGLFRCYCSYDC